MFALLLPHTAHHRPALVSTVRLVAHNQSAVHLSDVRFVCARRCHPHRGPCGQKSRRPHREQRPHIMLPELAAAGEGARPENCGE